MPRTRRSLPKKLYSENANSASGRLSESCVSEIFDCIKKGKVPTGDIAFNIIKTTEKKLMLSPPSYEFGGEYMHALSHSSYDVLSRIWLFIIYLMASTNPMQLKRSFFSS